MTDVGGLTKSDREFRPGLVGKETRRRLSCYSPKLLQGGIGLEVVKKEQR